MNPSFCSRRQALLSLAAFALPPALRANDPFCSTSTAVPTLIIRQGKPDAVGLEKVNAYRHSGKLDSLGEVLKGAKMSVICCANEPCPLNETGRKAFKKLTEALGDRAQVVHVVSVPWEELREIPTPFRMQKGSVWLSDPASKIAALLKLDRSYQYALVNSEGGVVATYNAVCEYAFQDLYKRITGRNALPLDAAYPKSPVAGCPFLKGE